MECCDECAGRVVACSAGWVDAVSAGATPEGLMMQAIPPEISNARVLGRIDDSLFGDEVKKLKYGSFRLFLPS
jgi:hypothetical protein